MCKAHAASAAPTPNATFAVHPRVVLRSLGPTGDSAARAVSQNCRALVLRRQEMRSLVPARYGGCLRFPLWLRPPNAKETDDAGNSGMRHAAQLIAARRTGGDGNLSAGHRE